MRGAAGQAAAFADIDGDVRGRVAQIDTRRCPLFLLSGEYDYSRTPEFLKYLLPVLEQIDGRKLI